MILKKDKINDIARRLDFIKIQLGDLKEFEKIDWETYRSNRDIQRNVERLAENVSNASIDICKILLAGEDIEMPNSYREVILKLAEMKILTLGKVEKIADYANLRNILAHQYLDIKWDKIRSFIANALDDYNEFIAIISKKIGI